MSSAAQEKSSPFGYNSETAAAATSEGEGECEDDPQKMMEAMFNSFLTNPAVADALSNTDMDALLARATSGCAATDHADHASHTHSHSHRHACGGGGEHDDDADELAVAADIPGMRDITGNLGLGESGLPDDVQQTISDRMRQRSCGGSSLSLQVKFASAEIEALYAIDPQQYTSDSGWDIRFTEDCTIQPGETRKFDFGVSIFCYDDDYEASAVWMVPRSSIVKTPLRMANSVGLIDSAYRGSLCAYVDNIKSEPFTVKKGDRLFQLASPSLCPFVVKVVDELPASERGENGFGSTGA
jgi:dUTP pyrophosphatase